MSYYCELQTLTKIRRLTELKTNNEYCAMSVSNIYTEEKITRAAQDLRSHINTLVYFIENTIKNNKDTVDNTIKNSNTSPNTNYNTNMTSNATLASSSNFAYRKRIIMTGTLLTAITLLGNMYLSWSSSTKSINSTTTTTQHKST